NRSNMAVLPPPAQQAAAGVLAVDGLLAHVELAGDVLPRPSAGPGVLHLDRLEVLEQAPEGGHGPKPHPRIAAARLGGELGRLAHARQHTLTREPLSTGVDSSPSGPSRLG